jgi:hypothetical protein
MQRKWCRKGKMGGKEETKEKKEESLDKSSVS